MEEDIIIAVLGIMLPIIISLGAFIMLAYMRKFENLERMAIIERGLDPKMFKSTEAATPGPLRFGFLLVGGGIGLLMGYWLDRAFYMRETGYFSMLFIFGGLGLLLAYLVEERRKKAQQ